MKTKKTVKQVKNTTCQVLIRNYPEELAEQIKEITGERTLSRALISASRKYLELKNEHEKMVNAHAVLQEKCLDMDSKISTFIESFDALRAFSGTGK